MKILIIGEPFLPPAYLPRVRYFCSYFIEKGWKVDLVTENSEHLHYVPENVTLLPINYYKYKQGIIAKSEWAFKFLLDLCLDYKGRYFYKKSKELLSQNHYDLVFCSSSFTFPLTVAARVAEKLNRPLFVDLRDIAEQSPDDNHYIAHRPPPLLGKLITRIYKNVSINRRNRVLRLATGVTTVSPWHVQTLSKHNPYTHLIYNGFDENMFVPGKLATERFTISYFGRIYNEQIRNPRLLFSALSELNKKGMVTPENTVVKWFVDEQSRNVILNIANNYNLSGFMEFHNFITPNALSDEMNKSSVLLVLCNAKDTKNYFGIMTTKFFEALGTNRPVVCIPDNNDNLSHLIKETKCGLVSSDELEVEKFLIEKLEEWQQKKRTNGMLDETIRMNFSRKKGAETLEKLFITAIKQQ
ncbi:MAG TPA: glycosyltransferase [Paludibacteraceae bacterium]|nr:glycosyltransferase [Paludibacteraceae bacterium]